MMSAKRFDQLMTSITVTARKVYDCVPMVEYWAPAAIHSELHRQGVGIAVSAVQGCLESLRQTGLIKETRAGFKRVPVREKLGLADLKEALPAAPAPTSTPNPEQKAPPMTPVTHKPAKSVVDILSDLSQQVAATTLRHQQEMKALADLIADAAIDVQAELEKKDADLSKWHQMQALLKGL